MRTFGFRLPLFVAVLSLGVGSTVWALGHNLAPVETVYVGPVTTTVTVPTSYVTATSWVEPTAYVMPTSYATAYVTDPIAVVQPSYVSTAYVRTGLFGRRRIVERPFFSRFGSNYLPTAFYVPTTAYVPTTTYRATSYVPTMMTDPVVWPTSYLASADCVCPDAVASAATRPATSSPAAAMPRSGTGSRSVKSEPAEEAMNSDVGPAPTETAPGARLGATSNAGPGETIPPNPQTPAAVNNTPTPPVAPKPQPPLDQPKRLNPTNAVSPNTATAATSPAATQQGQAGTLGGQSGQPGLGNANPKTTQTGPIPVGPPPVPSGDANDLSAPLLPDTTQQGETRRQVQRPAYSTRTRPEFRNILFGVVQSSSDGQPEEGVRVSVTSASDPNRGKSTVTNAFGRFSMRLYDGDWTVNVTMPSGRIYSVSQLRVNEGQITDSLGRRVPSLEITR